MRGVKYKLGIYSTKLERDTTLNIDQVHTCSGTKFQPLVRFKIDLKELLDLANFRLIGKIIPIQSTIITKVPHAKFLFRHRWP